jgi:hypothetical protein
VLTRERVCAVLIEHRQQNLVVGLDGAITEPDELVSIACDEFEPVIAARQQHRAMRARPQPLEHLGLDLVAADIEEGLAQSRCPSRRVGLVEHADGHACVGEAAYSGERRDTAAEDDRRRSVIADVDGRRTGPMSRATDTRLRQCSHQSACL